MTAIPLPEQAIALVRRWVAEATDAAASPAEQRLDRVLEDDSGLPFLVGMLDGVARPESLMAAASGLQRIAPLAPEALPWYVRSAIRLGGAVTPVLATPTVPLARRALRELVDHLIVEARPEKPETLGAAIARLRDSGAALTLTLLGGEVLGDAEAQRRLDGIHELIRRPDVDSVSLTVSSILGRIDPWSFDEVVDAAVERLLPLYLTAAGDGTIITLDLTEYRDLDLTIAVLTRLLEDPQLKALEAGIVLPASLPDALAALRELTAWARERVERGGARIVVHLVKGDDLVDERVDAVLHGWPQATSSTDVDVDATLFRLLDEALSPENTAAVRIGIGGCDLVDIAYAWLLAGERDVRASVELAVPLGTTLPFVHDVAPIRVVVPVVEPGEFDAAIGYLVRRLAALAAPRVDEARFLDALDRAEDPSLRNTPNRTQDRQAPVHESVRAVVASPPVPETDLTDIVLGISRGSETTFIETAVYSPLQQDSDAGGAPGFENTPDTDLSLPANRDWARGIRARIDGSALGRDPAPGGDLNAVIAGVRDAGARWGARPAAERADALLRVAVALEARRAELIEVAASETGVLLADGDVEVSRAVDFSRYYSAKARELDAVAGAIFVPSRVIVAAPAAGVADAAGGVLAALAGGSGVVLKPAPEAPRTAAVLADTLWNAGVPRDVFALVDWAEDEALVTHPDVDRVLLTGPWDEVAQVRSWRTDLRLLAQTGGRNAIVVTASADLDLAAADLVQSAFSRSNGAASIAILVGSVGRSKRFAHQLADAARSLRAGWPSVPRVEVGPLAEPADENVLGEGEEWLVEPAPVPGDETGRLWSPGIRVGVQPGAELDAGAPALAVMHVPNLAAAIELQNAVSCGAVAGLHARDPDELALWLDGVEAGSLFVNRTTTGAIVQRQPVGGWKRSSVGAAAKSGGPNYLMGLGSWRAATPRTSSSTLHLRGLDSRITELIESAQPSVDFESFEWLRQAALSDAIAWDREFGQVRDVSRLGVERNLFRYRPVPVAIRATADAAWHEVLRVVVAAIRAGSGVLLSVADGVPATVRHALGELGAFVAVEPDDDWIVRMALRADAAEEATPGDERAVPQRVRLVGSRDAVAVLHRALADAIGGDPELAVYDDEVTSASRIELLPFLREQSVSITAHRFGRQDGWSATVI